MADNRDRKPRRDPRGLRARCAAGILAALLLAGAWGPARAAEPKGQLTWAATISIAPTWFDPAETVGLITPYMVLYALHDALVKPMPGEPFGLSLAKSWTLSDDGLIYEFVLRDGAKFHNGEPVTSTDVKFSFERYRGASNKPLKERGGRHRDPRSATHPLQAQAALARLHDLLRERHQRCVGGSEEVCGERGQAACANIGKVDQDAIDGSRNIAGRGDCRGIFDRNHPTKTFYENPSRA